jgi:hypothetical protein
VARSMAWNDLEPRHWRNCRSLVKDWTRRRGIVSLVDAPPSKNLSPREATVLRRLHEMLCASASEIWWTADGQWRRIETVTAMTLLYPGEEDG